jgi:putative ABC transport system permease protein
MIAPLIAWFAGMLLAVRVVMAITSRLPVPTAPRFGSVIGGNLARSLRRRGWALGSGMIAVGLVVAFGVSLAMFAAVYDDSKAADSRFTVGSDVRVTPSVLSRRPHPPSFASQLEVPGVRAATPVVFKLENSVLIGPHDQNRKDLAAIEPASFRRVAALSDSFFVDQSAASALNALAADRRGLLVDVETADELSVEPGDSVHVLLARGTKRQRLAPFRVVGLFKRLPGFPEGTNLVAGLDYYEAMTRQRRADFFIVRTSNSGHAGLERAVAGMRSGPGRRDPLNIETTETALDTDQSSLTAINFQGLVDLNSFFSLLMCAAGIAIFIFGLMLQRRREYVTLLAQGIQRGELQALVIGEAAVVAACGLVAGMLVGTGMAFLLMHVLRGLFILDPAMTFPAGDIAVLVSLVVAATLASSMIAIAMLRRMRPTEILREQ